MQFLSALLLIGFGQAFAFAQDSKPDDKMTGQVDHVVATLTSNQFKAVNQYLAEEFPDSWVSQGETKGFLLARTNQAYAELWNSGVWYQYGYQVAFGCPEAEDAPTIARDRFGNAGVQWGESLFTVGSNGAVGHPVAGTFLVHPGGMRSLENKSARIEAFTELWTAIPEYRFEETENYRWFGMEMNENGSGFIAEDHREFRITAMQIPDQAVMNFGHIALGFRLATPVDSPVKLVIPDSGGIEAVFDGQQFWLVLKPALFAEMKLDN